MGYRPLESFSAGILVIGSNQQRGELLKSKLTQVTKEGQLDGFSAPWAPVAPSSYQAVADNHQAEQRRGVDHHKPFLHAAASSCCMTSFPFSAPIEIIPPFRFQSMIEQWRRIWTGHGWADRGRASTTLMAGRVRSHFASFGTKGPGLKKAVARDLPKYHGAIITRILLPICVCNVCVRRVLFVCCADPAARMHSIAPLKGARAAMGDLDRVTFMGGRSFTFAAPCSLDAPTIDQIGARDWSKGSHRMSTSPSHSCQF